MVDSMTERFPWLAKSAGAIDVTHIGRTYDLLSVVKERRYDIAYHKAEDVNNKGDAVLVGGCHEIALNNIPKEEWPYIADIQNGEIVIGREKSGYRRNENGRGSAWGRIRRLTDNNCIGLLFYPLRP